MKSPDGRFEVVQHQYDDIRMGSPLFGQLQIQGSSFGTMPGQFAEPVAFSPDSRFLAAAELVPTTPGPAGRVVVFDFQRGVPIIVHSFTGLARRFRWEPDDTLTATTWSHLAGEDTRRVWSPPPLQPAKRSWWKHLFQ
jgi:hypothetical protein